jgi:hypothetical protein
VTTKRMIVFSLSETSRFNVPFGDEKDVPRLRRGLKRFVVSGIASSLLVLLVRALCSRIPFGAPAESPGLQPGDCQLMQ